MALTPADFAAYSRATGAPYPEDPEERAQMATEVLEFRRNQLRGPEQDSPLPGILGAAAVGLGALTGGMALTRALRGNKGKAATSTAYNIPQKAEQDIRTVATPVRQRAAEDVVRQARSERMPGVRVVDLSGQKTDLPLARTPGNFKEFSRDVSGVTAAEKLAQDPELLSLVEQQAKEELSEARSKQSIAQAEYRNLISSIADDIIAQERASVRGPVVNQTIGALESGEDQITGRTMRAVQRNEDLDVSQVNQAARQTGSADVAASMTPDGIPVDQAEGVGYDLRTGEKFTFGGSRPTRTGLGPGGTIELGTGPGSDLGQSSAARFLQKRRLELLGDPEASTSMRLENKLAEAFGPEAWREDTKATRRRNALKLGAAGNEQFFENINEGTFTVGGEQFPVSLLKEGVFMEETAQNLADRANKYRDWLGNIRLEETQKQIRLGAELEALDKQDIGLMNNIQQISAALEQKPTSFKTPQERERYLQLKRDLQGSLERQDEIDTQINQVMREFELSENRLTGAKRATTRNLQKAAVPQKLASGIEEGIVVRPVLTAPDNIALAEGELSNLERGRPVGEFISQEQLEVVPGGLLSGGRAKSVVNIGGDLGIDPDTGERILLPNVDVNTGEMLVQKLAGKRMGADPDTGEATINVRGRGGVAGLGTKASIGIYGPELGEYGTSAMTKEGTYTEQATRPPTATETSVPVHKIRTYKKGSEGEDIPVYFNYPSSYEDPQVYKHTQQPTAQSAESFDVARQLRQLQQSGRPGEAQAFLDKIMKQRGISGTSGSFSPIR